MIGDIEEMESANLISTTDAPTPPQVCQCPRQTKPSPLPMSLPFPATEVNWEKLQQYLLDYYASSTFNTCEHQALPLLDSLPMRLITGTAAQVGKWGANARSKNINGGPRQPKSMPIVNLASHT